MLTGSIPWSAKELGNENWTPNDCHKDKFQDVERIKAPNARDPEQIHLPSHVQKLFPCGPRQLTAKSEKARTEARDIKKI